MEKTEKMSFSLRIASSTSVKHLLTTRCISQNILNNICYESTSHHIAFPFQNQSSCAKNLARSFTCSSCHFARRYRQKKTHFHKRNDESFTEEVSGIESLPLYAEILIEKETEIDKETIESRQTIENHEGIAIDKLAEEYLSSELSIKGAYIDRVKKEYDSDKAIVGSPNPNIPISDIPCSGCGAKLHCQDEGITGYMPSQRFLSKTKHELKKSFCQRCMLMKRYNLALNAAIPPEEYEKAIKSLQRESGLILLMVDVMDMSNSIYSKIIDLIGTNKPVYVVGNKIDLLPRDAEGYLRRTHDALLAAVSAAGLDDKQVKHVALVSAKTGYGIEDLVTALMTHWRRRGPVFVVGSVNSGKSSLFNALLSSDYCKSSARDFINRATTSIWPGTTLNLLKFPIVNPSGWRLHKRRNRLLQQKNENLEIEKMRRKEAAETGRVKYAQLIGHIGQTFTTIDSVRLKMDDHDFDSATYTFKKGLDSIDETVLTQSKLPEARLDESKYVDSQWCYDTPGLINPQQIINELSQEELSLMLANRLIRPHTYIMHPEQTMFLSGLARIQYLEGPKNAWLTVISSDKFPVHVMWSSLADEFYQKNIGTHRLGVPLGDEKRLRKLAALDGPVVEVPTSSGDDYMSMADLVLSSIGWASVYTKGNEVAKFKIETPGGVGLHLRIPSLLPYAVRQRGKRIQGTPSYRLVPATYMQKPLRDKSPVSVPDHIQYGVEILK